MAQTIHGLKVHDVAQTIHGLNVHDVAQTIHGLKAHAVAQTIHGLNAHDMVQKCKSIRVEPEIKLQKADFFRNDTWTSPQTNSEDAPKIPLVHFFNSRWPPPCNAIIEKNRGIP